MLNYEDMRDFQYGEENPGYRREVGLTAEDLADCDPDTAMLTAESYARDNGKRREHNLRTDNDRLRELLEEHGIDPDEG